MFQYLAGLAVIQIPELDMSAPHSYKVGAVLREGHTRHLTGHLIGCHNNILLQESKSTTHVNNTAEVRGAGCGLNLQGDRYLPGPDVDHHVMLVSHTDDVFAVGGESHTGDAIFVLLELCHLSAFCHIPQSHRW